MWAKSQKESTSGSSKKASRVSSMAPKRGGSPPRSREQNCSRSVRICSGRVTPGSRMPSVCVGRAASCASWEARSPASSPCSRSDLSASKSYRRMTVSDAFMASA